MNLILLIFLIFFQFVVLSNFLWALDKEWIMSFDIYSATYYPWSVPLVRTRFKDLLMENARREEEKETERYNFPIKERRERRKSQRRGESHARSLRNRERREIRDVHFFERRNASCSKRADDLGVPAGLLPCPPSAMVPGIYALCVSE